MLISLLWPLHSNIPGMWQVNVFVTVVLPKNVTAGERYPPIKPDWFLVILFVNLLFFSVCYHQRTVPLTCTDMRFILFIDNLFTLYWLFMLIFCMRGCCFFVQCLLFFTCNVPYDLSVSLKQIHRWRARKREQWKDRKVYLHLGLQLMQDTFQHLNWFESGKTNLELIPV